jgi:hypothetical protein
MGDRFRVRRPPHRLFGRSLEIGDRGISKIGADIVVREDLGLSLRDVRISLPWVAAQAPALVVEGVQ